MGLFIRILIVYFVGVWFNAIALAYLNAKVDLSNQFPSELCWLSWLLWVMFAFGFILILPSELHDWLYKKFQTVNNKDKNDKNKKIEY